MKPLDDLEMFELLQAAYPEKFIGDSDEAFEAAQEFAESISGWEEVADLLGRVAMLTMPMEQPPTGNHVHVLGEIKKTDRGSYYMMAAVKRPVKIGVNNAKQS